MGSCARRSIGRWVWMRWSSCRRSRLFVGALLVVFASGGCGDDAADSVAQERSGDLTASGALVQPSCETSGTLASDPLTIGRKLITAAQAWDVALICSMAGVPRVPHGLVAYHEALVGGLSSDLELVSSKVDEELALFNFDVPARGGGHRLGLAFQKQSRGWVLITTAFLEQ